MLSKYFKTIIKTEFFKDNINKILDECENKKVLIYGAGCAFYELNKLYKLTDNLDIVAIADKKFEKTTNENIFNIKCIKPKDIKSENFDIILVTNESYSSILYYLTENIHIDTDNIKILMKQEIKNEKENFEYLSKYHFDKQFPKLINKLKNKRVILFGADEYLELITKLFDISKLNIIAISDKKYLYSFDEKLFGYNICTPQEIIQLNPDYVLISEKYCIKPYEYLHNELLKNTSIKILPLVDKSFFTLLKELYLH